MLDPMNTQNLALRPNCLLTRYPLVFISGPRSLFCTKTTAYTVKLNLEAHGYPTKPLILAFRDKQNRLKALTAWLESAKSEDFHFMMADESFKEFESILRPWLYQHQASTVTLITTNKNLNSFKTSSQIYFFEVDKKASVRKPLYYRLHELFCRFNRIQSLRYETNLFEQNQVQFDRFLDHCIELAENDLV